MSWAKVLDGSAFHVLLDDRRAYVRRAGDRGCVAELIGDTPDDSRDDTRVFRDRLARATLGEADCRE
jgi:hypothetical protein